MASSNYYPQLDTLRAFAVTAVIAGHYLPDLAPAGWLGVDVFFVISGFVISKTLSEYDETGWRPALARFYANRVRRLVPALLLVVVVTTLSCVLLLTRPERAFVNTGVAGLFGVANLTLYHYALDYFAVDAQLNPFTHLWSLGVEEQFYLVFPPALFLLGWMPAARRDARARRHTTIALAAVGLASLGACLLVERAAPMATFYLPMFRAWELAIGVLCFLLHAPLTRVLDRPLLPHAALLLLVVLSMSTLDRIAVLVLACVLSAVLVAGLATPRNVPLFDARPLQYLGRLSYSLYLWHWPLLVLANWTVGTPPVARALALVAAVLMAALSYHAVEAPLRRRTRAIADRGLLWRALAVGAIAAVTLRQGFDRLSSSHNDRFAGLFGVAVPPAEDRPLDCHGHERLALLADPLTHCLGPVARAPGDPHRAFLLGDSHAGQWVTALGGALDAAAWHVYFIVTDAATDPYRSLLSPEPGQSAVLDYIDRVRRPGDVVLIAFHRGRLNESQNRHIPLQSPVPANDAERNLARNLAALGQHLLGGDTRLLLMHDTPLLARVTTVASCALQIRWFGRSECGVSRAQDLHTRTRQDRAFAAAVAQVPGIEQWDPADPIFAAADPFDAIDGAGRYNMRDWNHLAPAYSAQLALLLARQIAGGAAPALGGTRP